MKRFRGRAAPVTATPPEGFGEWLVRRITPESPTESLTFAQLEQVLSNAGSLLCGAVYADPGAFLGRVPLDVPSQYEAMIIARRTADGFEASLKDRTNVVLAWPWDHLGTRVAWLTTQASDTGEAAVGGALFTAAVTYALMHGEQLTSVFELWESVVAGLPGSTASVPRARNRLPEMGRQLLDAYNAAG
ncbi:MAG: hypothetical protein ACRDG3_05835 [Tepidiformaceae bacterium]